MFTSDDSRLKSREVAAARVSIPVAVAACIFFIITLGAIVLATQQIHKVLTHPTSGDSATAIGELLLVVVLGMGEILAFFALLQAKKEGEESLLEAQKDRELTLLQAEKDRELHTWIRAQEIWTDKEFLNLRRRIFERLPNNDAPWTDQQREEGLDVCRKMDDFARLARFLGTQVMLDTWAEPLARAWFVLEPLVNDEREKIGSGSTKWDGFENIGKAADLKLVSEGRDFRKTKANLNPT